MVLTSLRRLVCILLFCKGLPILAEEAPSVAEKARAAQAMQIQLMAADLLDELVYQWTQHPPLPGTETSVVLMRLSSPIGLNLQMTAFLENHFFQLLKSNPKTGLAASYCGTCLELTSYSTAKTTIIARGAAIPEVMEQSARSVNHGLYLDLEASGSQLMLRAYISDLSSNRIVAAKSLVTQTGRPPHLRLAQNLVSAEEARREYVDILQGRRHWSLLAGVRSTILQSTGSNLVSLPYLWGQIGVEAMSSSYKKWLVDLQVGFSSLPGTHNAHQISSRMYRLMFDDAVDLTAPNIYTFIGLSYWNIDGAGALFFQNKDRLNPGQVIEQAVLRESRPRSHNTGLAIGIEVRMAELFRLGLFAEMFLNQFNNSNFGKSIDAYGLDFGVLL